MDFRIALDRDNHILAEGGTSAKSNVIYIPPGSVALLSLYNMLNIVKYKDGGESGGTLINESCLTLHKLSFGPVDEESIEVICGKRVNMQAELKKLLANRRVFSEPVYEKCCEWSIDPANNFVMIPVPGFYELQTTDVDQLDVAYVEYAILTAQQSVAIPDGFKLGG